MSNLFSRTALVVAALTSCCLAQPALVLSSASTVPGGTVAMGLSFSGQAGSAPAGLQWTFTPSASVTALSIVASPALSAAGKSIQCAGGGAALTCIDYGLNGAAIPTGPLAVVHARMAANAVSGTVGFIGVLGASAAGDPMPVSATGGLVAVTLPVVSVLNCTASGLASGATASCTVILSSPVLSGASVQLNSNSASLSVPATVQVAAGAASATFTVSAGTIGSDQSATITATLNGVSAVAGMALTAPALSLASLQCAPGTLMPNAQTNCTATLTRTAPAGGTALWLRSSTPDLALPLSVSVPSNATSVTFTATAGLFTLAQNAVVTASLASVSRTATVALVLPGGLSTLTCTPLTIFPGASGNCTVTLTSAASTTNVVTLVSTNPGMRIPATATISSGNTTATFAFNTTTTLSGWVILSAALGSVKRSVAFTLSAAGGSLTGSEELPATFVQLKAEGQWIGRIGA